MSFVDDLYGIIQKRVASGYTRSGYSVYPLTKHDIQALKNVADKYGFPPEWLANLINFESAGTFNPAITNSIGATGLIQFLSSTAIGLGTTTNELRKMNFQDQMLYVDRYLHNFFYGQGVKKGVFDAATGRVNKSFTQMDLFMIVFYPSAVGIVQYKFPENVVAENNGISQPSDYVKLALNAATAPFRMVPSVITQAEGYLIKNTKKVEIVAVTLLFITGLTAGFFLIANNRE